MICEVHWWRRASDGLVSCSTCGKIAETWTPENPSVLVKPRCDCGAKKTYQAQDYSPAHARYCRVAEGKR